MTQSRRLAYTYNLLDGSYRRRARWYQPKLSWLGIVFLLLFCLIYGFAFALFAPYIIVPFALPIVFVGLFVIWVLPDFAPPVATLNFLFFSFFIGVVVWPNYISIALPGLPWISIIRLTGFPLVLTFLICLSVSAQFRHVLAASMNTFPLLWKCFAAFVFIQTVTLALSGSVVFSINRYLIAQAQWTAIFVISCYLFLKPGRALLWATSLWIMALFVGAIGVWECRLGYLPWRGHIPSFLQIEDPSVIAYLNGAARAALGIHRAQSTYATPLGLSEYIALTMPFVFNFLSGEYRPAIRIAAVLTIPFLLYVVILTDSRLGVIGFLITVMSFILIWSIKNWRKNRGHLFWNALIYSYPLGFVAMIAATFIVGHLRTKVWGGGAQQYSTLSRIMQWQMGIPKILANPFGHGIGRAGVTLGFVDSGGVFTIDSYYLQILLEYGVVGFALYYSLILLSIWYAGKYSVFSTPAEKEFSLLTPLMVALLNFLVIKSVFSQQDNHPLIFMMMGMIVALVCRIRNTSLSGQAKLQELPPASCS